MRHRAFIANLKGTVTTITGLMTDQAALSGVLETLYELHLTLLNVEMQKNGIEAKE